MSGSPDLEYAYNPRVSVPDFATGAADRARMAQAALERMPGHRNIRYGTGPRQLLDIFAPRDATVLPVVIYFHGGYWRALSKDSGASLAETLLAAGFATVNVGYDLCPEVTVDHIVDEVCTAVRWTVDNIAGFGGDPRRIILSGVSAGAHLAAMVLNRLDLPYCGACLVSGIYDIEPVLHISVNDMIGLDADAAKRNSPMLHPPTNPVSLLIAYGADETPEWRQQSMRYAEKCRRADLDPRVVEIPEANHFSTGLGHKGSMMNRAFLDFARGCTHDQK